MMASNRSIVLLFVLCCIGACGGRGGEKDAASPAVVVAGDISLVTVRSEAVPETVELSGIVRAGVSAVVAARVPGTVGELKVAAGDRVQRGELLALLDSRESVASAALAEAAVEEAGQALEEARARKRLADTTFGRFEKLYREQAVTHQEYDVRFSEREVAGRGVRRAEARFAQARESAIAAAALAGHTRVTAPVSGVVTTRQADRGSTVFPGQPLLTIEDEKSYLLELSVPESLSLAIRPGMGARVSLDAQAPPWDARIRQVVPAADPASRTFIAKVPLDRPGIRSGLFGRARIRLPGRTTATLLLPAGALVERGGLTSVWLAGPDNRISMRLVKTGKTYDGRIEILAGLQEGERVVIRGLDRVGEGMVVK